ncbi:alpha/beta fold hydrolase [Streptomyces sp. Ru62]|uniref:alpha/beta fold hydrolase n=1 Tax=Streptomyces sp. Ru62 TaxID=2080745 RepID=UPI0015E2F93D|nr:alpha/beta hydrolase [Streptomyces sp. Ru62]
MTSPSLTAPDLFKELDGTRFACRRFGRPDGVPLVLLSRFRGTMDDWNPLFVDALAEARPVILFDNAGIGRSEGRTPGTITEMAVTAAAFVAAVADPPVDLLGFSLGGYVAQRLTLGRPELVRRLVLAGTGPGAGEGILPSNPQVAPLRSAPEMDPATLRALFFTRSPAGARAAEEVWHRTHQRPRREPGVPSESWERQIDAIAHWSSADGDGAYDSLERLSLPVLVANGSDDVMIPTVNSFVMSQRLPDAELVIYPDSGHGFLFQYAELFAARVDEFLDRPVHSTAS